MGGDRSDAFGPSRAGQELPGAAEQLYLLPAGPYSRDLYGYGAATAASGSAAHGQLSAWQTFYHVVSFLSGSGMLCLPLALVEIDWYGMLLLVAAALVSSFTCRLLVEALDAVRWASGARVWYSDLAYECFGCAGQYLTAALVHVCFLMLATGQLTLAAACITGVTGLHSGTALVLLTVCLWFQVFVPSLRELAAVSAVNVGLSFWIESVIFGDAMYPLKQIAEEKPEFVFETPDLTRASVFQRVAYISGLVLMCVFCHTLVPSMYNAMREPRRCAAVVSRSVFAITALLYLPVCSVTYAVYGPTLEAPVFFNMRNVAVRTLAIVLYAIHLLMAYGITMFPLQRAFENWLLGVSCGPSAGLHGPPSPRADELLEDHVEATVRVILRTMLVLVTTVLSYLFLPNVVDVFAWLLVPLVLLSLLLPSVFYWKICREDAGRLDKLAVVLVSALGVALLVGALGVIIRR